MLQYGTRVEWYAPASGWAFVRAALILFSSRARAHTGTLEASPHEGADA